MASEFTRQVRLLVSWTFIVEAMLTRVQWRW